MAIHRGRAITKYFDRLLAVLVFESKFCDCLWLAGNASGSGFDVRLILNFSLEILMTYVTGIIGIYIFDSHLASSWTVISEVKYHMFKEYTYKLILG